jgi:hypothetical protein
MTDFDAFERRLAAAIRADADMSVGPFTPDSIAHEAIAGVAPGASRLPRATSRRSGRFGRGRGLTLLAAATLLLVGGAVGSGILRLPSIAPKPSINLETSAEIQAFVLSSSERLAQLPPEAITTLDSMGSRTASTSIGRAPCASSGTRQPMRRNPRRPCSSGATASVGR